MKLPSFVPMKRLVSILLIMQLVLVGASSIVHQLEQSENHNHKEGTHLCEPDHHHHCSLCDVVLQFGDIPSSLSEDSNQVWYKTFSSETLHPIFSCLSQTAKGRAPPAPKA